MTKPRSKPKPRGEYIPLFWDCDHPKEEYIHGHLAPDEFRAVFERERGDGESLPIPMPAEVRHEYGRYVFNGQDDYGDPMRTLKTYPEPGRGLFKVSVVVYDQLYPPVTCGICEHTIRGPREMADGKPNHWTCIERRQRDLENATYFAQKAAGWSWRDGQWVPPSPDSCEMPASGEDKQ